MFTSTDTPTMKSQRKKHNMSAEHGELALKRVEKNKKRVAFSVDWVGLAERGWHVVGSRSAERHGHSARSRNRLNSLHYRLRNCARQTSLFRRGLNFDNVDFLLCLGLQIHNSNRIRMN
jgi:hypothetical protein